MLMRAMCTRLRQLAFLNFARYETTHHATKLGSSVDDKSERCICCNFTLMLLYIKTLIKMGPLGSMSLSKSFFYKVTCERPFNQTLLRTQFPTFSVLPLSHSPWQTFKHLPTLYFAFSPGEINQVSTLSPAFLASCFSPRGMKNLAPSQHPSAFVNSAILHFILFAPHILPLISSCIFSCFLSSEE